MDKNEQAIKTAAKALRAGVRFSAELVSIVEMKMPLSVLNNTLTAATLRQYVADMVAFVEIVESANRGETR